MIRQARAPNKPLPCVLLEMIFKSRVIYYCRAVAADGQRCH